jgi:AraC family transcriptional regulator
MLVDSQPGPQGSNRPPVSPAIAAFVERAAALIEIDRDASRQLLLRAVALLRTSERQPVPHAPPLERRCGGLAPWQVSRVAAYVEQNIGSTIRAAELAAAACLSPSHFFRSFKAAAGMTPARYISQRRIEHACQEMSTTRQSLTQIALICGFCDQAHFTKVFRRWTGESPLSWRRAHCRQAPPQPVSGGVSGLRRSGANGGRCL